MTSQINPDSGHGAADGFPDDEDGNETIGSMPSGAPVVRPQLPPEVRAAVEAMHADAKAAARIEELRIHRLDAQRRYCDRASILFREARTCNEPSPTASLDEVRVIDPKTGGQKGQKIERFDLIPPDAHQALARVYGKNCVEHGGKYEANNWLKGYRWTLSVGAIGRHLVRWMLGESYDTGPGGDGEHHLMHIAWHCFTLFVFETRGLGTDDIPTRQPRSLPKPEEDRQ